MYRRWHPSREFHDIALSPPRYLLSRTRIPAERTTSELLLSVYSPAAASSASSVGQLFLARINLLSVRSISRVDNVCWLRTRAAWYALRNKIIIIIVRHLAIMIIILRVLATGIDQTSSSCPRRPSLRDLLLALVKFYWTRTDWRLYGGIRAVVSNAPRNDPI